MRELCRRPRGCEFTGGGGCNAPPETLNPKYRAQVVFIATRFRERNTGKIFERGDRAYMFNTPRGSGEWFLRNALEIADIRLQEDIWKPYFIPSIFLKETA